MNGVASHGSLFINASVVLFSVCTATLQVEGRGQGDALLAALSSGLQQFGVNVNSAAQQSEDGMVLNVFKVTTTDGKKVPKVRSNLLLCVQPHQQ